MMLSELRSLRAASWRRISRVALTAMRSPAGAVRYVTTGVEDAGSGLLGHPLRAGDVVRTKLRRAEVIHDPYTNRGTAFSADERERLGLRGLVPPRKQVLQQQVERIWLAFSRMTTPLDKFQFMSMLMDRNTVLFYVVFIKHFREIAPIVYTPTVGEACEKFHAICKMNTEMQYSLVLGYEPKKICG